MAHIDIVDQTFRDGRKSLWGLRIRAAKAGCSSPMRDTVPVV